MHEYRRFRGTVKMGAFAGSELEERLDEAEDAFAEQWVNELAAKGWAPIQISTKRYNTTTSSEIARDAPMDYFVDIVVWAKGRVS